MALPKPGDFITAKCGRCSDVTGHVVMLVLDGQVAKVECKACGSVHKYRETRLPGQAGKERASVRHVRAGQERDQGRDIGPKATARKAGASAGLTARRGTAAKLQSAWQEAMVRHSAETPAPYGMDRDFALRDFIEHPVFGRGEVISSPTGGKMEVLFQDGVKLLRCKA